MERINLGTYKVGDRVFVEYERRTGGTVEILDIIADHRRTGYGRRMVEMVKQNLGTSPVTIYAFTRLSNEIARAFWRGVGFRESAIITRFYQDGTEAEPAVMYCLEVNR